MSADPPEEGRIDLVDGRNGTCRAYAYADIPSKNHLVDTIILRCGIIYKSAGNIL